MRHDAEGFWLGETSGAEAQSEQLRGSARADVAIVGGGYTGMWAAWWIKQLEPGADVALLESRLCGHGPSGRNGGFCNSMWFSLPTLRARFGDERALAVCRAAADSVAEIGRWCEAQGVDAAYRRGGYLQTSAAAAQDGTWDPVVEAARELGVPEIVEVLDAEGARRRCDSPLFRGAAFYRDAATVHPARLASGLRERLIGAGVRVYENSGVRKLRRDGDAAVLHCGEGKLTAGRAILAAGGSLLRFHGLRLALTATSSHMVITEPVPELLDELGWRGGECITDSRAMIHYFRTTTDDRIAFGWGGGAIVPGARLTGRAEVDAALAVQVEAHLRRFFPQLAGARIEHAWGGPIDVSPTHLPVIRSLGESTFAGFGYTGNGVGPSQMVGRSLASLALDRRDEHTKLAIVDPPPVRVPPEPFRYLGGTAIRRAILRKERLEEEGRRVDAATRFLSGVPERLGIHVGR
jgi:glycine/D-amino acid oxidase-like deaminating enzyme